MYSTDDIRHMSQSVSHCTLVCMCCVFVTEPVTLCVCVCVQRLALCTSAVIYTITADVHDVPWSSLNAQCVSVCLLIMCVCVCIC